jgi:two-component system, chemotaxis family, protein-glutamate methylesterase/glutaminase
MGRARVLVVDDSAVVRRLVSKAIDSDPLLEVVGTAANGQIALHKLTQLRPDLVTLDVEMPGMDGIETLKRLRADHPLLPVIMFSTLTERGAAVTLEALMLGANDYVTKPVGAGGVDGAIAQVCATLLPKVRALCRVDRDPGTPSSRRAPRQALRAGRAVRAVSASPRAVVVGVSTGGPKALAEVLPALPADLAVPVLVVQHMPPVFTRLLAERLDKHCALEVREAVDGEVAAPGTVRIAPGDRHLLVRQVGGQTRTVTSQGPRENSCRPATDVLFRSASQAYGAGVLGVVLTGMGSDGVRGSEVIVSNGGTVIAQDEGSSVVWGMPGGVVAKGLAGAVEPLDRIAAAIVARTGTRRAPVGAG